MAAIVSAADCAAGSPDWISHPYPTLYRELDRSKSRKLRHDAVTRPAVVAAQAASATQTIEADIARNGGKSAASEKRRLAKAYIPSGNTRLQNIGV